MGGKVFHDSVPMTYLEHQNLLNYISQRLVNCEYRLPGRLSDKQTFNDLDMISMDGQVLVDEIVYMFDVGKHCLIHNKEANTWSILVMFDGVMRAIDVIGADNSDQEEFMASYFSYGVLGNILSRHVGFSHDLKLAHTGLYYVVKDEGLNAIGEVLITSDWWYAMDILGINWAALLYVPNMEDVFKCIDTMDGFDPRCLDLTVASKRFRTRYEKRPMFKQIVDHYADRCAHLEANDVPFAVPSVPWWEKAGDFDFSEITRLRNTVKIDQELNGWLSPRYDTNLPPGIAKGSKTFQTICSLFREWKEEKCHSELVEELDKIRYLRGYRTHLITKFAKQAKEQTNED